jgi:hypothetical protein
MPPPEFGDADQAFFTHGSEFQAALSQVSWRKFFSKKSKNCYLGSHVFLEQISNRRPIPNADCNWISNTPLTMRSSVRLWRPRVVLRSSPAARGSDFTAVPAPHLSQLQAP